EQGEDHVLLARAGHGLGDAELFGDVQQLLRRHALQVAQRILREAFRDGRHRPVRLRLLAAVVVPGQAVVAETVAAATLAVATVAEAVATVAAAAVALVMAAALLLVLGLLLGRFATAALGGRGRGSRRGWRGRSRGGLGGSRRAGGF